MLVKADIQSGMVRKRNHQNRRRNLMETVSVSTKRNYKKWGIGITAALGALLLLFHPNILMSLLTLAGMAVVAVFVLYAAWKIVSFLFFFVIMIAGGFVVLGAALWIFQ